MSKTVEILAIGREILDGRVVDTNSTVLAKKIAPLGLTPRFAQRVDDHLERIVDAFKLAKSRSDIILVCGGLGPTSDDLTAQAFAHFLGVSLRENQEALESIKNYLKSVGRSEYLEQQKKQTLLPDTKDLFVFDNDKGTAPGFGISLDSQKGSKKIDWYFMPGVPSELIAMFEKHVLPRLPRIEHYLTRTWVTHLIPESEIQARLCDLDPIILKYGFELTYRTKFPENHIGLHGVRPSCEEDEVFDDLSSQIASRLRSYLITSVEGTLQVPEIHELVFQELSKTKSVLCTVESCTGGRIASQITSLAGASQFFWGSFVVYDNSAKINLGVSETSLNRFGAVSEEVARELSELGLKKILENKKTLSDQKLWCLATTGIAGPTGGSLDKPIGLCWVGLSSNTKETVTRKLVARKNLDRERNLSFFTHQALDFLRLNLVQT